MTHEVVREPPTSLAVRLRRAESAIRARLLPLLAEHDLTMEHWRILGVVDDQPGIGMGSVASAAVVPAATLTRHMDKLVERGLVVRHVDPDDKRRVVLALSPRGQALSALLRAEELEVDDAAVRSLFPTEAPVRLTV